MEAMQLEKVLTYPTFPYNYRRKAWKCCVVLLKSQSSAVLQWKPLDEELCILQIGNNVEYGRVLAIECSASLERVPDSWKWSTYVLTVWVR